MNDPNDKPTPEGGFRLETLTAQGLGRIDETTRAVVPPIHPSTTFLRDPDGAYRSGRGYTRADNPSYDIPEDLIAKLEGGAQALLFSSGMSAAGAIFQALLPGDHVVAPRVMYWALRKWLGDFPVTWGLAIDFVDMCDLDAVKRALRPGQTRLIWAETPANPTWDVVDLRALADLAHEVGARLGVDSTAASPVLTRPIEHGADYVMHSASKYLNGHSDVLAGAVVCAKRDAMWQRIRAWQRDGGAVLGPFEAWLLLRGMRTLHVRVDRACESAMQIARHFEPHPKISHVLYPGLPGHPGHDIARRQMHGGFGGMLSLRLSGGDAAAVATAANVTLFKRATSLGGVESLIEHRASIEGPSTPVPGDLLRLSIGLEDPKDLIWDIEQALRAADNVRSTPLTITPGPAPGSLEHVVENAIGPVVVSRGGEIELLRVRDGVAELRTRGSPGAAAPLEQWILETLKLTDDSVQALDLRVASTSADPETDEALQTFLDREINPAVAEHGGYVRVSYRNGPRLGLLLEGRCQGCAMAEVTLRQGIEPALRRAYPEIAIVTDETNHSHGTNPYFSPGKGGEPEQPL